MRVLCVAAAAVLSSASVLHQVHEPTTVPNGWRAVEAAVDPQTVFTNVVIGLRRSNVRELDALVNRVSDPRGDSYLQYPGYDAVGAMVRPKEAHIAAVRQWLREADVTKVEEHPHGDVVQIEATAAQLQKLCGGEGAFVTYEHEVGMRIARMTSGVRVPAAVAEAVETFSGFNGFPLNPVRVQRPAGSKKQNVGAAGVVTPPFLRRTYNISSVAKSGKTNIQAIAQFQGQYVRDEDLLNFCHEYDSRETECKIAKYFGRDWQWLPGIESMLDTEYITPLGGVETWVYSYPSKDFCSDVIKFAGQVSSQREHPWVISISYGSQKIDFCDKSLIQRFAQDVEKLAALGITVLISSGDDGSGHNTRQGVNEGKLSNAYPSSVPHAVAVGSTWFQRGTSGAEEASTQFGSGGGFSYDFSAPSYQTADIASYLGTVRKPTYDYARGGRGTPDVATLGQSFTVLWHGLAEPVGGTSASAPTFAGIVTLLNEVCLAAGGKSLGFANPLFYQNSHMFTDITKGTNAIGENKQGWEAIRGWDASTGLGTPNFPAMVGVVRSACARAGRL